MKVLLTSAVRNTGMAAIRGLAYGGADIIGADERRLPFGCRSRYLQKFYLHAPVNDEIFFLESVLSIIKKERPDVFFPIEGTHLVSRHAALFEAHTRILLPPYASYQLADDNQATLEACRDAGIDCPHIFNDQDAKKHLRGRTDNTLVIKPRRDIGAGRGVKYVHNPQSLRIARKEIIARWGDCVIQEYIPGGTANMRTLNLLFDRCSRLAAYFTTRKIRQWPNTGGISALSISTRETELVAKMLPFFKNIGWQGLAEVELKIDDRDNQAKVIEINPRVWGYFGFPICSGVNFPLLLCHAAIGRELPPMKFEDYRIGLKYINPLAYIKAVVADWPGITSKKDWLPGLKNELQGPLVGNALDWRDAPVTVAKILFETKAMFMSAVSRKSKHA